MAKEERNSSLSPFLFHLSSSASDREVMTIGTYHEKSLHAELKRTLSQPGDVFESPVDGYIIDIVRGDLLMEIQTRNFSALKIKLATLLKTHHIRLIHPIASKKWITRISTEGEVLGRRKSPRHGEAAHIFLELVSFPQLIESPRFSLEILIVEEEEIQRDDGKGSWRRKRRSIIDRKLISIVERRVFASPRDFIAFLPPDLAAFTTRELAKAIGQPLYLAQKMAYCLRNMGVLETTEKAGNAFRYTVKAA